MLNSLHFDKHNGLVPAIVQDATTHKVLMLGYMNAEALEKTEQEHVVTFFSRSKSRLWTKGETSGNILRVAEIRSDCDNDTVLIKVHPTGPVCHTGTDTCFDEVNIPEPSFLHILERIVLERKDASINHSYTAKLLAQGINKVAQKFGEEAIELIIEAKDYSDSLFREEAADVLYHFIVLLAAKGISLESVLDVLRNRHVQRSSSDTLPSSPPACTD
ncbi:MAG: bifunctional phosphoribosyl-AMP cyclohydrolase/phosphoribosyl-ATP diphosphatase HisIE [Bacteroidota bacterium]|nr:bifunctional phosphoribosyl-AMP cyclohydrolase/phosphoribosyl-ATP diphosphatase HisIE [Candidatus Kapabacteria bacterium]MDW8219566.1 bifunctional phosphoribosyl-AMP cyclohydrolase/phosphoribosyl-ATP diphosphatase HisIE [Bacteroidota bacterium]